jgi:ribosomal 30S subunit maturation factor RimM
VDVAGAEIGVVEDVLETGAEARVLVVSGRGGETLLPFAAGFVREVDLAQRRIVASRPEYVLAD